MRTLPAVARLVAVAPLLAGCAVTDPVAPPTEVTVRARDWSFFPPDVTVHAGDVVLTLVNEGTTHHHWQLRRTDGREIDDTLAHSDPGHPGTVRFTVRRGRYDAWCDIPGHVDRGMRGTLTAR